MLLNDLIESISNSVSEAQDRIERHQIERFKGYFDSDHRPEKFDIRLPSLHPDAGPEDEDLYRVPILPLVSSCLLKIKDVEIDFDIDLIEVSEDQDGEAESPKNKALAVDLSDSKKRGRAAHVVLKLEGRDLSEGMARVIERLVSSQGKIHTDEE